MYVSKRLLSSSPQHDNFINIATILLAPHSVDVPAIQTSIAFGGCVITIVRNCDANKNILVTILLVLMFTRDERGQAGHIVEGNTAPDNLIIRMTSKSSRLSFLAIVTRSNYDALGEYHLRRTTHATPM